MLWSGEKSGTSAGNRTTNPHSSSQQISHYTDWLIPAPDYSICTSTVVVVRVVVVVIYANQPSLIVNIIY